MDGWMDGWMNGWMDGRMDGEMDERTNERTNEWTNERMNIPCVLQDNVPFGAAALPLIPIYNHAEQGNGYRWQLIAHGRPVQLVTWFHQDFIWKFEKKSCTHFYEILLFF